MAERLWGNVYFDEIFAGQLVEEPNGRCLFTYDKEYIDFENPTIALSFPLERTPFISESGLHPFFDNLVAEGWLQNAQARSLKVNSNNRFALLLGFGFDLAGAVSIRDPRPKNHEILNHDDDVTAAALRSRASLSGIQRKLLVLKEKGVYRPVQGNELSTHIAKLPSNNHRDLIELEYLTTEAVRKLLPNDQIVNMELTSIAGISEKALIIERFDRTLSGKRIHFEEFNQLLGHYSGDDKYKGSYEDLGFFICNTPKCIPAEIERLYGRILVCLLIGNTDAHFKNFAMFHTKEGLRLTPAYDLVASSFYKEYNSIALSIAGARNLNIGDLKAKHLIQMAKGFKLNEQTILEIISELDKQLPKALETIEKSDVGSIHLRRKLIDMMEKRWNGSFGLTGKLLLKKQNKGENISN